MKTNEDPFTPDLPQGGTNPFRVPDGYFEGLTDRILSALPERPAADAPRAVPLIEKVKPLLYLAAAFLGMMLLFKGLNYLRPADEAAGPTLYTQHASTPDPATVADDESDFLDYLEAQYADLFFPDDFDEWE